LGEFSQKALGRRIAYLRRKLGLKQKDLASLLGKTVAAVASWEVGRNLVPTDVIAKLVKEYEVNPLWLLFGEGPMFLSNVLGTAEKEEELTDQELIKVIKKLDLESVIEDLIRGSEYYARVGIRLREILEKIREEQE